MASIVALNARCSSLQDVTAYGPVLENRRLRNFFYWARLIVDILK